jgi:teichoic acid transport system permease protein
MIGKHRIPGAVTWILDHNPPLLFIQVIRSQLITVPPTNDPKIKLDYANAMFLPPHAWLWLVIWAAVVGLGGYLYFWQGEETYGRG